MSDARPEIGRRMARASAWMILQRLAWRVTGLATTIIMARILVPEDFGLVAIATTVFGVIDALSQFGFDRALIRNQNAGREHYDTAWTLSILRSTIAGLVLWSGAGFAADFFEDERLADIVKVLAVVAFIRGFQNVGVVNFQKQLWFGQDLKFRLYARAGFFVTVVALGLLWRDYWALVAGICAEYVLLVALSYVMHDYAPRLSLKAWREILGFSKWILANNVITFLNTRLDYFVVSKVAGAETLGFYSVANQLSTMASSAITAPATHSMFPGFAKVADERARLADLYLKSVGILTMIAMPAAVGVACLAEPVVMVLFGQQWLQAVPLVQVLALYGIVRVTFGNATSVMLAAGRPDLPAALAAARLAVLLPLLIWATSVAGAYGAAWAVFVSAVFRMLLNFIFIRRLLALRWIEIFTALWRTLTASLAMALVLWAAADLWTLPPTTAGQAIELAGSILLGGAVFTLIQAALWCLSGFPHSAERILLASLRERLRP